MLPDGRATSVAPESEGTTMVAMGDRQSARRSVRGAALVVAAVLALAVAGAASAQPSGCSLVADDHNPSEKILRCGSDLTIRTARGTRYKPITNEGQTLPTGAELDSGALMIEGTRDFQILTPHAIAAVRGTKWAIEVTSKQTSTLVISGVVEVKHRDGKQTASLRAGQGADISPGSGAIEVKRWKKKRVKALLARFGQ
jgi:ferric-dicitrate binding protein FerR (iron transport regulator)